MFDVKHKKFWVLYSTIDMTMKLVRESKDGFGTSMYTDENTGLLMLDWTYKICSEGTPVFVRGCRARTPALYNPNT